MNLCPEHLTGTKELVVDKSVPKIYKQLQEHGLAGHSYFKGLVQSHDHKNNRIINTFLLSQFNEVRTQFLTAGIKFCLPLKGISLIHKIYQNIGDRRLTDIDILIQQKDIELARKTLLSNGFVEMKENKWLANQHKYVFIKKNFLADVEVEIHTELFYHFNLNKLSEELELNSMSLELEFLYLCYHLAEQHNFLKLKWLYDLFLYFNKFENELDFEKIEQLAFRININTSLKATLFCLYSHFNCKIPISVSVPFDVKPLLNWNLLLNRNRRSLSYLRLKSYLKSNRNMRYYVNWLKHKAETSAL